MPKSGHIEIFDRSWYGRVLVERVEGFASQNEWQRASDEINQFEKMWTDEGTIILKFFLCLDKMSSLSVLKTVKIILINNGRLLKKIGVIEKNGMNI